MTQVHGCGWPLPGFTEAAVGRPPFTSRGQRQFSHGHDDTAPPEPHGHRGTHPPGAATWRQRSRAPALCPLPAAPRGRSRWKRSGARRRGSTRISRCPGPGLPAAEERGCCGGRLPLPGPARVRAPHGPGGGAAHLGTQLGADRSISHVANRFMGTGTGTGLAIAIAVAVAAAPPAAAGGPAAGPGPSTPLAAAVAIAAIPPPPLALGGGASPSPQRRPPPRRARARAPPLPRGP